MGYEESELLEDVSFGFLPRRTPSPPRPALTDEAPIGRWLEHQGLDANDERVRALSRRLLGVVKAMGAAPMSDAIEAGKKAGEPEMKAVDWSYGWGGTEHPNTRAWLNAGWWSLWTVVCMAILAWAWRGWRPVEESPDASA